VEPLIPPQYQTEGRFTPGRPASEQPCSLFTSAGCDSKVRVVCWLEFILLVTHAVLVFNKARVAGGKRAVVCCLVYLVTNKINKINNSIVTLVAGSFINCEFA
jgi:hypothetical protein